MKRFHVHVSVDDIAVATRFYATLFGAEPTVAKPDYAKWMLDDPRVNFAISSRGHAAGLDHVGIQVDEPAELGAIHTRLESGRRDHRRQGCGDLLLREVRQGLGHRSGRPILGDVPHLRRVDDLWQSRGCAGA